MPKARTFSVLAYVLAMLAGLGVGMLIQAKVQLVHLDAPSHSAAIVSDLSTALRASSDVLTRTTAERDRLLEHLADVESGSAADACMPVMGWICPDKGGR